MHIVCNLIKWTVQTYTGNAKDRVLVVLLSDRRETFPEYTIWPDIDTGPDMMLGPKKFGSEGLSLPA